jgi:hypothetical protein
MLGIGILGVGIPGIEMGKFTPGNRPLKTERTLSIPGI